MTELEQLKAQKREIEEKIRALKNQSTQYGMAKIDVDRYPTAKPDRHFLAIYYKPIPYGGYEKRNKWQTIFSANDRQSVIDAIPAIVSNLQKLYENLTAIEETNG